MKKQYTARLKQSGGFQDFFYGTSTAKHRTQAQVLKRKKLKTLESTCRKRIVTRNRIRATPFRRIDEDLLKLITLGPKSRFNRCFYEPLALHSYQRKIDTHYLAIISSIVQMSSIRRVNSMQPLGSYRVSRIPISSTGTPAIIWDQDIRKYLDENGAISQILTAATDRLLRYIDYNPVFSGLRIRFLKDPDDPNPVILIQVNTNDQIDDIQVLHHKEMMRSMLTSVVKEKASSNDEYIKLRAAISLILREG